MIMVNIKNWRVEETAAWLSGVDPGFQPYVQAFVNNGIDGAALLLLTSYDLEKLSVASLGHRELILEAVELLNHLHHQSDRETLQTLCLSVTVKCRSLAGELRGSGGSGGAPCNRVVAAVSSLLGGVKTLVSWLDRYPFEGEEEYAVLRSQVVRLGLELAACVHVNATRPDCPDMLLAAVSHSFPQ
ncbi:PREDICTED: connector enhancer of kinase suppressor of ras 3-like [Priapulus caudatus]|uniref:Connector enhancer of kinase suppressor of ras 3-like n=1 Tax=Priapulus caudatus TaxID=37621 RepID=A0ABM1F023_PRICU|nr:PREDICTED: connector enhancer of kinase suppressor of ras 3-like [Priapulus caudatus]